KAGTIKLTDVWYVPDISGSLILVSRVVDAGYTIVFGRTYCTVMKEGVSTELGQREGNLYCLIGLGRNTEKHQMEEVNLGLSTNQSSKATIETWHRRLCHRSLDKTSAQYISQRVDDMNIIGAQEQNAEICGVCAVGRQHKEAATKAREKASDILTTIHSDLCGPMETNSLNGDRYFVTFIDETSGRVSIALL